MQLAALLLALIFTGPSQSSEFSSADFGVFFHMELSL
jgi:hypothetical protein